MFTIDSDKTCTGKTAPQGLEPQIPVPETGVLPITPGRNETASGYRREVATGVCDPVAGSGDVDTVSEQAAGLG